MRQVISQMGIKQLTEGEAPSGFAGGGGDASPYKPSAGSPLNSKKATGLCHSCPKLCRYSCPVANADQDEATTPWGKMSTMLLVDSKKLPMTKETMGLAYKCLNCRASEKACEMHNPVSATLNAYRFRAFRASLAPEGVYDYCQKFQKENNPFEIDLQKELQKRFPGKKKQKNKITYFPGCTETARSPQTIEKTFRLLQRLKGPDVGLYAEPIQCCGYPLFVAGDWDNFVEIAEINQQSLADYPVIVSGAPACLYTMEVLYRSASYPPSTKFLHITEYLDGLLRKTKPSVKKRRRQRLAYHDPCYLGRYRQTYEAPRRLITELTGQPPIEFFRNQEESYCCGAGGLLPISFPETADKITRNRIDEFYQTKADLLVSSCPTCVQRFRKFGVEAENLIDTIVP